MALLAGLLAFLTLLPLPAVAAALEVRVIGSHPGLSGQLPRNEALYVRLSYRSDVPIRVQAKGFVGGAEASDGVRWNPSPAYPAGSGEAMVWIAYAAPTRLDELRVEVSDARWQPLLVAKVPVDMSWSSVPGAARPAPDWVNRLNAAQQDRAAGSEDANGGTGLFGMLIAPLMMLAVPGYFVLQLLLGLRYAGAWRFAALAPLLVMAPAVAHALFALAAQSNLWPIVVILTAPFAFLYLAGLAVARRIVAAAA